MFTVSFVTSNPEKLNEFEHVRRRYIESISITGERCVDLPEILGSSYTELIENKALAAFTRLRRPVVVDHASLQVARLRNLPGPASKPFWDAIGRELHNILSRLADDSNARVFDATVRVDVAYCDAQRIFSEFAEVPGKIVPPSGNRFDWDQCFSPDGAQDMQSYASMNPETKFKFSARAKAIEKLLKRLHRLREGRPRNVPSAS